jgi:hypothetical protein
LSWFFLIISFFLAQTKKATVLEIERKFVMFKKKQAILFSSCILVTLKFGSGRQTCCPSRAEKGQRLGYWQKYQGCQMVCFGTKILNFGSF